LQLSKSSIYSTKPFSPTKAKNYQRYNERIKGKRQEWGILCNND
ncbi:hypothetical protein, partial [Escherichia coli]